MKAWKVVFAFCAVEFVLGAAFIVVILGVSIYNIHAAAQAVAHGACHR